MSHMTEASSRDPLAVVLQFLILCALIWIAVGISSGTDPLVTREPTPDATTSESIERLLRILEQRADFASGRALALEATAGKPRATGGEVRDATAAEPSRSEVALAPVARTRIPPPPTQPSWSGGPLFDFGEQTDRAAGAKLLHAVHRRLQTPGTESENTSREFLLMDRWAILHRFGRPHSIRVGQIAGFESWYYQPVGGARIRFEFMNGYVTRIR